MTARHDFRRRDRIKRFIPFGDNLTSKTECQIERGQHQGSCGKSRVMAIDEGGGLRAVLHPPEAYVHAPAGGNLLAGRLFYILLSKAKTLDHAFLLGVEHKLEAAVEAELLVDVMEVNFDGAFRDSEPVADGAVPQSCSHHLHNLDFPPRQRLRYFAFR